MSFSLSQERQAEIVAERLEEALADTRKYAFDSILYHSPSFEGYDGLPLDEPRCDSCVSYWPCTGYILAFIMVEKIIGV